MNSLTMPIWKSSIQNQTSATMTLEIRKGSRMMPRTTVDLVSRCISTAIPTASMVCTTMLKNTYCTVTLSEFQNSGSRKIRT